MPEAPTLATVATAPSASPAAAGPQSVVTPEQHAVAATAPAKVTPGSKAWAEMTAEQRHEHADQPPGYRDQHALVPRSRRMEACPGYWCIRQAPARGVVRRA